MLLGEVEVVLDERVLGAVGAADHAAPAQQTARAVGPLAAEVGVADSLSGRTEEDPDGRLFVALADAELLAELTQQPVDVVVVRVLDDAEHALGLGVVRREGGLPVLERGPLRVFVEGLRRGVQGVGVAEAAAADAAPGDDGDVPEGGQPEDALHAELGVPEVAPQVGGGARQLVVGVAPAALEHADRVALLGEPQRAGAAAESRPDHQPVEVEAVHCPQGHRSGAAG